MGGVPFQGRGGHSRPNYTAGGGSRVGRLLDAAIAPLRLNDHCVACGGLSAKNRGHMLKTAAEPDLYCALCGAVVDHYGDSIERMLPDGTTSLSMTIVPDVERCKLGTRQPHRRSAPRNRGVPFHAGGKGPIDTKDPPRGKWSP